MEINRTLVWPHQIDYIINWGEIHGDIANQTDLMNLLNSKADIDHNHDDIYLSIDGTAVDSFKLNNKPPSFYTTASNINYDNSESGLLSTNVQDAIDELALNTSQLGGIREIFKSVSCTLTINEVSNTIINNLGQINDVELILPEAKESLTFTVIMGSSSPYQFKIKSNPNDMICLIYLQDILYLYGIYGAYAGLTSVNKGESIKFSTFKSGNKYEWLAVPISGQWISYNMYYGTTPEPLSVARDYLAATTVGNYALFGGGYRDYYVYSDTVDAYDTSLTRTIPTPLSVARGQLVATTVGNYALFGGGYDEAYKDTVDAYDTSLTRTIPEPLSVAREDGAATTVGNYALFGGGFGSGGSHTNTVDAYDTSLTRTISTPLSIAVGRLAATTVGNYALFGGGSGLSNVVDAYDTSLTRTIPTPLSVARRDLAATTVGNYALFGGGRPTSNTYSNVVDAYDTSLTRTIPTPLSVARDYLAATTVGNYALFGGGYAGAYKNTVDAYDTSLTRTIPTPLSVARTPSATTVGNYALFSGRIIIVDAYDTSLTKTTLIPLNTSNRVVYAATVGNYALFSGGVTAYAFDLSLTSLDANPLCNTRTDLAATNVGGCYALFAGGVIERTNMNTVDVYDMFLTKGTVVSPLSVGRKSLAATNLGNYALFGGGWGSTYMSDVDVYYIA